MLRGWAARAVFFGNRSQPGEAFEFFWIGGKFNALVLLVLVLALNLKMKRRESILHYP